MTERQIECFLCLSRTLNFNQAARELFLSQPAVSQQIVALEKDLGVTLFNRDHSGVSLTAPGIAFLTEAADYLEYSRRLVSHVRQKAVQYSEKCEIRYMIPLSIMPDTINEFHKKHPHALVRVYQGDHLLLSTKALFTSCDIAIAYGNPDEDYDSHEFIPLYQGSVVAVMSASHRLADKDRISVEDLEGEMIYSLCEHLSSPFLHSLHGFITHKHGIADFFESTNSWEASLLAESGYGVAIIPYHHLPYLPGSVIIPFDFPLTFNLGLFIRKNAPSYIKDFCEIAKANALACPDNQVVM